MLNPYGKQSLNLFYKVLKSETLLKPFYNNISGDFKKIPLSCIIYISWIRFILIQFIRKRLYNKRLLEYFSRMLNYNNGKVLPWKKLSRFFNALLWKIRMVLEIRIITIKGNSRLVSWFVSFMYYCCYSSYFLVLPKRLFA